MLDPVLGFPVGVDHFWGRHLRAICCPCIIECFTSTFYINFCYKTLLYRIQNLICNNLTFRALTYGLYVCIRVFLLHQESLDMILTTNLSYFEMGVLHSGSNAIAVCFGMVLSLCPALLIQFGAIVSFGVERVWSISRRYEEFSFRYGLVLMGCRGDTPLMLYKLPLLSWCNLCQSHVLEKNL
jgi:hypothetical protein